MITDKNFKKHPGSNVEKNEIQIYILSKSSVFLGKNQFISGICKNNMDVYAIPVYYSFYLYFKPKRLKSYKTGTTIQKSCSAGKVKKV